MNLEEIAVRVSRALASARSIGLALSFVALATALAQPGFAQTAPSGSGLGQGSLGSSGELAPYAELKLPDPSPYHVLGTLGGSWGPASKTYTIQNTGTAQMWWVAAPFSAGIVATPNLGRLDPGSSTTVAISFEPSAVAALGSGSFPSQVGFFNLTSWLGNTLVDVSVTLDAPPLAPGELVLTTPGPFLASGKEGDSFAPAEQWFVIENVGSQPLAFSTSLDVPWAHPGALTGSGTLDPGKQTGVKVLIDQAVAATLPTGFHTGTIRIDALGDGLGSVTAPVQLSVTKAHAAMSVTPPAAFASAGPVGGPFAPASTTYTVANTGGQDMLWEATTSASWIELVPASGTLSGGAQVQVEARVATVGPGAAALLSPGAYAGTIRFRNKNNGDGTTEVPTSLQVTPVGGAGPILTPGPGWFGATPEPPTIGAGPGSTARAMAHWDVVAYQDVEGDFEVGVVAFHRAGIDRVEFSVENGPWSTAGQRTLNPRTGVLEHWVTLRAGEFASPGRVELRAIAYPNVGHPRVLPSLYVHVFPGGVPPLPPMWCAPWGNDWNGDGSQASPYRTPTRAAARFTDLYGRSDGGVVYCMAGDYDFDATPIGQVKTLERYVTIRPAPGVGANQARIVSSKAPGIDTDYVRIQDMHVRDLIFGGSNLNGQKNLWVDGGHWQGAGPGTSVHAVGWFYGFFRAYWTGATVSDNQLGPGVGKLLRDLTIERIDEDVFRGGAKLVVNCDVHDVRAPSGSGLHPDLIQVNGPSSHNIYYGLHCTDVEGQGFFVKGNDHPEKNEFALVNVLIDGEGGFISQLDGVRMDHLVLWHCTFDQLFNFRTDELGNLSVRGSFFDFVGTGSPSFGGSGVGEPDELDLESFGDWIDNHYENTGFATPGTAYTVGDPKFTNASANDYSLQPSSPLLDRLAPLVPIDVQGTPRTTPTSIGAFHD